MNTDTIPPKHPGKSIPPVYDQFLEETSCPICGEASGRVRFKSSYPSDLSRDQLLQVYRSSSDQELMDRVIRCSGCELVYLNPRVRREIALESYSTAVDPTFVTQNESRIKTFERSWRAILARTGLPTTRETKVLDIGAAGGAFLKVAKDSGVTGIGIEPSAWLCDFGKKEYGVDLRQGTMAEHRFADAAFDVVTMWDVLEHLYEPMETLSECYRLTKKGGWLVVNYPDYASAARKLLGRKWPFFLSVHLYYFTPHTLTKLLAKAGFEVEDVSAHWQTLELSYVFKRAAKSIKLLSPVEKLVERAHLGGLPLTYNMGQTLVLARKP